MTKQIKFAVFLFFAFFISSYSNAQSTLIHYWHFNNYNLGAMHTYPIDTIHSLAADYSIHDTSKARILYSEIPGTSSSYSTYIDSVTADATDTVNARMGVIPGFALRVRNPSDQMQLLFYIPTTHYYHITLKYGSESSSATHGQLHQLFDYSVDSGLTWRTSGLSISSDSAWLIYHRTTLSFTTDTMVNNNNKLVFRIKFSGNDTGSTGNNRFDNVSVEGDSITSTSSVTNIDMDKIFISNPVKDRMYITIPDEFLGKAININCYDQLGRLKMEKTIYVTSNVIQFPVNLVNGNYFIQLFIDNKATIHKIIIKN